MEGECCLCCDGKTHYASSPGEWARYITKWKHTTIINPSYVLSLHTHYRWRIEYFWLLVTDSWQLKTLKHITNKLQTYWTITLHFLRHLEANLYLYPKNPQPTWTRFSQATTNNIHIYANMRIRHCKISNVSFDHISTSTTQSQDLASIQKIIGTFTFLPLME